MYTPYLRGLRQRLLARGVPVSPIHCPECAPSGEISLADPDGYVIVVGHWGKAQQERWEKRIGPKT
jgi:hypothetical protein